jgi:hypothetical protein
MSRVMITNGNNFHPADYHAEITAEKIVVVGESASAETLQASRAFRKKVEAILVAHHETVEGIEQAALAEHGEARYGHCLNQCALDATDESVLVEIAAASRGTILEAHFHRADVQAAILQELHHETRSQMNVHRDVHREAARLARHSVS